MSGIINLTAGDKTLINAVERKMHEGQNGERNAFLVRLAIEEMLVQLFESNHCDRKDNIPISVAFSDSKCRITVGSIQKVIATV